MYPPQIKMFFDCTFFTDGRYFVFLHPYFKNLIIRINTMGGFFGTISKSACATDLFYGTDYNSHLGTRRGGMATYDKENGFTRPYHNLVSSYF